MTYRVIVAPSAARDLERINPRIVPAIIEFMFGALAEAPRKVGKPLRNELEGYFGARRGPYRIIYAVDDADVTVEVVRASHRADAFRGR